MSDIEKKSWNWLKIALIISVCVNILVLSAIGTALIGKKRLDQAGIPRLGQIESMFRALPDEKRKELRRSFREEMIENSPRGEEMRAARAGVVDALFATPYSASDLETALKVQRDLRNSQAMRAEGLWVEIYSTLTDEERAAFKDSLEEQLKKRRDKKRN